MTLDIATFSSWIGKTETMQEQLSPELVGRFNATLGSDFSVAVGESAPPLIHLCLAQPSLPADQLGEDGHPRRGGFLPPVPLPRRMWAGSAIRFHAPLAVGATVAAANAVPHSRKRTVTCEVWSTCKVQCRGRGLGGHLPVLLVLRLRLR